MKAFEKDVSQMLHGTGIFTYIYHKLKPKVSMYTSPMGMALLLVASQSNRNL